MILIDLCFWLNAPPLSLIIIRLDWDFHHPRLYVFAWMSHDAPSHSTAFAGGSSHPSCLRCLKSSTYSNGYCLHCSTAVAHSSWMTCDRHALPLVWLHMMYWQEMWLNGNKHIEGYWTYPANELGSKVIGPISDELFWGIPVFWKDGVMSAPPIFIELAGIARPLAV